MSDDIRKYCEEDIQSINELALSVLSGEYGYGAERKKRLGHKYEIVQNRVNEILIENSQDYSIISFWKDISHRIKNSFFNRNE